MVPALLLYASLVNDVRTLIARHNLPAAEEAVRSNVARTSDRAAALSWIARAWFDERRLDQADQFALQARTLSLDLLRSGRQIDADPWLPTALGAAIEVHAQVLAARGQRSEAVAFLREEVAAYGGTSIGERLRKNLNLLSLEGKPAPPLDVKEWLGDTRPQPLSALRGHPVLLFFWAHWCADCKAEAPILASLRQTYGPKGLVVVAPTKLYGYVAGGEDAAPAVEKQYIEQVRSRFYPMLAGVPVPASGANFLTYGASTTPTIVLIDASGVVRYYHPGNAPEEELAARIRKLLTR
jgi:thiol-disulfide isomerase/thioredoxin